MSALTTGGATLTHTGVVTTAQGGFAVGAFTSPIYLSFLERRNGLGGGVVNGQNGQDQYLNYGTPVTVQETSQFLLSLVNNGQLARLVAMGLVTIVYN